ncbi:NADH-ubiquinone oxidoreductase-F iron-sulfur binding region domain-containing protein [Sedimenticola hydrogenitrophicus]|uniref:NADH-ubiquinone oxidoreductase-F iron-sulfur binding region domain-containing protein n=1 Tax=Sedimenticola hydrogenitrophicus TaxID=2967975 RepID=UPI0023B12923|nr:NADH-ubiquinone oxidoreductase-F iron-sulfur binding region domain-containing protein [Sedimenticola hydrogenitrophicus]
MAHSTQVVAKHDHPGAGRKKTSGTRKGRQVDPAALAEVRQLLGDRSRQRDLLIEHLHLIQDHAGCLSEANLSALAYEMGIAQTEVFEVATFYAHFDVVKAGQEAPPAITVRVCDSISCKMAGSGELQTVLEREAGHGVRVIRAPCMGRCDSAPVAEVGHSHVGNATIQIVLDAIRRGNTHPDLPEYEGYEAYVKAGGYAKLQECLDGSRNAESVIDALDNSELRGMGGAGFPAGRKWRIVNSYPGPRLMAVNCDEGEPGTFKDRYYLERYPHRFIEGMLIAAWVVEAKKVYIYVRDEYPAIRKILQQELDKAKAAGLLDGREIEIRRGAGAYICGEESAMIESIEGKRGLPRNRPPYVAEVGLFGRPTLEHNVETLYWVRDILEKGAEWFSSAGRHGRKGWRSYSVSGRVKEPGVKLAPAGITIRELIDEYCGGMLDGHGFKAYLPGGASGGILPASMGDVPLDFGTLEEYGCFIGSAAVVVFSDHDNMRDVALNLMEFFEDESCGQCTPCRVGTEKAVKLMQKPELDTELLTELSRLMGDASICGLGQAAGNPVNSLLKYFREDFS